MPLKPTHNSTPYEILFKQSPNYNFLKAFGCLCYVSTPKHNRAKLEPRAIPCVFLGYAIGQKGYKVLNLQSYKILVSRDVVFHEFHYPFHLKSKSNPSPASHLYLPVSTPISSFTFDDIPDIYLNTQIHSDTFDSQTVDLSTPNHNPPTIHASPYLTDPLSSNSYLISKISSPSLQIPQRQSTRTRKKPAYLSDYHCLSSMIHWCNLVSLSPNDFSTYSDNNYSEPQSYEEAVQDTRWVIAMDSEIKALKNNNTWEEVTLPKGKKTVKCKWVYKIKLKSDGSLERFKARLVAKGYTQKHGVDFEETFSPVIKMPTLRCVLSLASHNNLPVYQLDINNAFLHGDLVEEIYMEMPKEYLIQSTKSAD